MLTLNPKPKPCGAPAGRTLSAVVKSCGPARADTTCACPAQLPMRGVPAAGLPTHLARLRVGGYTLVGLEQTADSTPLPEYR